MTNDLTPHTGVIPACRGGSKPTSCDSVALNLERDAKFWLFAYPYEDPTHDVLHVAMIGFLSDVYDGDLGELQNSLSSTSCDLGSDPIASSVIKGAAE